MKMNDLNAACALECVKGDKAGCAKLAPFMDNEVARKNMNL